MKKSILLIILLPCFVNGQTLRQLKVVKINPNISTHFICPDPVEYIDLSTNNVTGDIPAKNIVRVKPDSPSASQSPTVLTIVGQKYIVQYKLVIAPAEDCTPNVDISHGEVTPIEDPNNSMSESELASYALQVLNGHQRFNAVATYKDRLEAKVVSIVSKGEYFFIKVRLHNHTNIRYDIDQVRFSIDDKKVLKATNSQSIEIKPQYAQSSQQAFRKTWENVYAFKKFTFPGIKDFTIRFSEKQISGRVISIHVSYSDILNADAL